MHTFKNYQASELGESEMTGLQDLWDTAWPIPGKTREQLLEQFRQQLLERENDQYFIVWEEDRVIANTEIFLRWVHAKDRSIKVLALAGVCVLPHKKGLGLGKKLVQTAFTHLDSNVDPAGYEVCLFQTGVPQFYEKLGAGWVSNEFYNSQHPDNPELSPWWEKDVMAYPNNFSWPEGRLDLNGAAY